MTGMWPRRPEKFVSGDGTLSYTFPNVQLQWQPAQPLRVATAPAVGANYGFDYGLSSRAPKDFRTERFSFWVIKATGLLVDAELDTMKQVLYLGAAGRLYTTDDNGVERWCWARLSAMPSYSFTYEMHYHLADVQLEFMCLSDWFATAQTTTTVALTASGQTITFSNPGNAVCGNAVFTFAPTGGGASLNTPKLTQATAGYGVTGQNFQISRNLNATTQRARVDVENCLADYSTDSGVTYANDYANLVLPATQVPFLELAPGTNTLTFTCVGSPSGNLTIAIYPGWH